MPLTGLNRTTVRPRGGVAKVELTPAPEYAGAVSTPRPADFAVWAFAEDRAHYSETLEGAVVRHTLAMEFAATAESRAAIDSLAAVAAARGVVARVTLASGETLVAGYSLRFGAGYPLRLVRREASSGRAPGDLPTISITLESID
jgi:hypothetical protein